MVEAGMTVEKWLERYPELSRINTECSACGEPMTECYPFRDKEYAGIESLPCKCGKNRNGWSSRITITKEAHDKWQEILGG